MNLYGIDIETHDPHLSNKGASWVYGEGEIIVTGLFDVQKREKIALDGDGGSTIKELLLDTDTTLVGANIQYDLGWLCYAHKLKAKEVKCSLIDVAIAETMIDEYQPYSLDALALKYLKERKESEPLKAICDSLAFKGDFRRHLKKLWDMGYEKAIKDYVISDADQPVRIWIAQKRFIPTESLGALEDNFKLIKIVLGMKQRGVRIDMKKRQKNYLLLSKIRAELQKEFEDRYGRVNFNSSKQLASLFDREKIPYRCKIRIKCDDIYSVKNTLKSQFNKIRIEKGQLLLYIPVQYAGRTNDELASMGYMTTCNPNIDQKALNKLRNSYDVAKAIVDLKQVTSIIDKFLGPNFDRFIVKHGEDNYRIHADFNIVGARQTGRFSSANPNLQQVPSKTVLFAKTPREIKLYKLCREIIIPDEDYLWGKADYSGQENRLMAHFAVGEGADEIRKKYNVNPELDFHQYIGEISGLYNEYGAEIGRKYAKNCSFGLGYGMQINTMMETFGWSREEAERITQLYHEGAPFVRATMDRVSDVIVKRGYIRTLAGRHCHLRNNNKRDAYKGFNKLIQGSAADMTKRAMVVFDESGLGDVFPLYLTVHDELDFGVPHNELQKLSDIQKIMENTFQLEVPIRVDPELGKDWGHVKGREIKRKRVKVV